MNTQAKPRIKEANRRQLLLRPINVEKLVSEDHPVRAIWEFVGRMDLSRFYASVASLEGQAGRSAWDPRLLICIWIYAYSQGIPSAREIERRFEYDPAFQWLTGMEVINHHTLSDFRMSGKATLDELFTQVLAGFHGFEPGDFTYLSHDHRRAEGTLVLISRWLNCCQARLAFVDALDGTRPLA